MPHDDAVIAAMGRCLAAWKSPDVVEWLIGRTAVVDDAWRADRVLRAAGAGVKGEDNLYDQGREGDAGYERSLCGVVATGEGELAGSESFIGRFKVEDIAASFCAGGGGLWAG